MDIAQTLQLLAKATGMTAADIAMAIPRAGANTVSSWLKGEKMPGRDQLEALARVFGVPTSALLTELALTLDPHGSDEQELLAAYRALGTRQKTALLEIATGLARRQPPNRPSASARKPSKKGASA